TSSNGCSPSPRSSALRSGSRCRTGTAPSGRSRATRRAPRWRRSSSSRSARANVSEAETPSAEELVEEFRKAKVDEFLVHTCSLLAALTPPRPASAFRVGRAAAAATLLRFYREAERRSGVAWQLLAAVNYVESDFGRVRNESASGAQGPMQFIPPTWRTYGRGDVHDPHAAILGAARFLRSAGAPGDVRGALYRYNPSRAYVDAILRFAARIRRDRRA